MVSFTTRLADGWHHAQQRLALAVVPMVPALVDTNKLLAILRFDGGHIGFKFGLPLSVVTVWQFVSVPNTGVDASTGIPLDALPLAIVTVPAILLVQATLTAGYFGSLRDVLDDRSVAFLRNCQDYFPPFLVFTLVPFLVFLPIALGVAGTASVGGLGGLGILFVVGAMIVFLLGGYLFYATPYLIVLREDGILDAARQSYALAIRGGPYFNYAGGFVLFVLGVSPVVTALVVNISIVGIPGGILGGGLLGLTANITTMRFVADIDPDSSVAVSWEEKTNAPSE